MSKTTTGALSVNNTKLPGQKSKTLTLAEKKEPTAVSLKSILSDNKVETRLCELIKKSRFFDEGWYKNTYNDIRDLDIDFAKHYFKIGWKQGRSPSFQFSGRLYLETNRDVRELNMNPLAHYELIGSSENRHVMPYEVELLFYSELFDENYYYLSNHLNSGTRLDACLDYLKCGDLQRLVSAHFNPSIYLRNYPDVEAAGVPPLLHYELHGRREKRTHGVYDTSAKFFYYENKNNIATPAKRVCLFAFYSINGTIPSETVYLLEKIRTVSEAIILIGDCGLNPAELSKISHLICYAKFERHLEYDFGSYKRAFAYAETHGMLASADELLICNDSIVGPCGDINNFFHQRKLDGNPSFYGITVNNYGFRNITSNGNSLYSPHIQSYFFTISKVVFESSFWRRFIYSIKSQDHKINIIRDYEMGMSKLLSEHGHRPLSMYKSSTGLNPAALEPLDVLNEAFFIKKSILNDLPPEERGVANGIFKAKNFPFFIRNARLVSTEEQDDQAAVKKNANLKIVDADVIDSQVFLFTVSSKEIPSLELLISSQIDLISLKPFSHTKQLKKEHQGLIESYLQNNLTTYVFIFELAQILDGARLHFMRPGEIVPIEYLYGKTPCYNFMKHRELSLYPRIENNILVLAKKKEFILSIMLSDNYSSEDKRILTSIVKSEKQLVNVLFAERASLACDNAYEAFKYHLNQNKNCFYITSKSAIANEKNKVIKKHMVEYGSPQHLALFLEAKKIICSFGYFGAVPPGLKDIHTTMLNHKLYLMWHGISAGDKNSYEIAAFNGNSSDGVFACSQYEEENFKRLGHRNIFITGYPRMDKWANDQKLDLNCLIIFFTWRRSIFRRGVSDFLQSRYLKIITDLITRITQRFPEMKIYYFLHNSLPSKHAELLAAIVRSINENVRFVNNNDQATFNKIFNSAQFMITDYSSAGYDFAYHKKRSPIFFVPDEFIAGHYIPTSLFHEIQPGTLALDQSEVIQALNPNEYKKNQDKVNSFFSFVDGANCMRSLQSIN